jgi:hypothetical protein
MDEGVFQQALGLRVCADDGADRSIQSLAVAADEQLVEGGSPGEDMQHELLICQCTPLLQNRSADHVHDPLTVRVAKAANVTVAAQVDART